MKATLTISIIPEKIEKIDALAKISGVSRSKIIDDFIDLGLFLDSKKQEFKSSGDREKFEAEMVSLFESDLFFNWIKKLSYSRLLGIESAVKSEKLTRK